MLFKKRKRLKVSAFFHLSSLTFEMSFWTLPKSLHHTKLLLREQTPKNHPLILILQIFKANYNFVAIIYHCTYWKYSTYFTFYFYAIPFEITYYVRGHHASRKNIGATSASSIKHTHALVYDPSRDSQLTTCIFSLKQLSSRRTRTVL